MSHSIKQQTHGMGSRRGSGPASANMLAKETPSLRRSPRRLASSTQHNSIGQLPSSTQQASPRRLASSTEQTSSKRSASSAQQASTRRLPSTTQQKRVASSIQQNSTIGGRVYKTPSIPSSSKRSTRSGSAAARASQTLTVTPVNRHEDSIYAPTTSVDDDTDSLGTTVRSNGRYVLEEGRPYYIQNHKGDTQRRQFDSPTSHRPRRWASDEDDVFSVKRHSVWDSDYNPRQIIVRGKLRDNPFYAAVPFPEVYHSQDAECLHVLDTTAAAAAADNSIKNILTASDKKSKAESFLSAIYNKATESLGMNKGTTCIQRPQPWALPEVSAEQLRAYLNATTATSRASSNIV